MIPNIFLRWCNFHFRCLLLNRKIYLIMAHGNHDEHHHGHQEAEQNEIGGPVTFAIFCFVVAVVVIYFWAQ